MVEHLSSRVTTDASFDSLYIARNLQQDRSAFVAAEVHLFAYLSCILWLYRYGSTADWGYSFVGTNQGAPYSLAIGSALDEMLRRGILVREGRHMRLSARGELCLRPFENMTINKGRVECIRGACGATAAMSRGMVNGALSEEPELRRARTTPANRPLLEGAGHSQLFEHLDALRRGLGGKDEDLRVPAVVWLSALHEVGGQRNR